MFKIGDVIQYKQDERIVQVVLGVPDREKSKNHYTLMYIGEFRRGTQMPGGFWNYPASSNSFDMYTLELFNCAYDVVERFA